MSEVLCWWYVILKVNASLDLYHYLLVKTVISAVPFQVSACAVGLLLCGLCQGRG